MSQKKPVLDASAIQRKQHTSAPNSASTPTKLVVKFAREIHLVPIETIDYIESIGRKVFIHSDDGIYQMYSTMRDIIAKLPESFLRCHNSYLVNSECVVTVRSTEIVLTSGAKIPISKRYAKGVRERLAALEHEKQSR